MFVQVYRDSTKKEKPIEIYNYDKVEIIGVGGELGAQKQQSKVKVLGRWWLYTMMIKTVQILT